jgi:hypothetical protein
MDILEPQISKDIPLPALKPKIEVPGFSLEMNVKPPEADTSQVGRLLRLLRRLKRSRLVQPLGGSAGLDQANYYADQSLWYHGLFSFQDGENPARVVTYLMWRFWQDSILLLIGSPQNILGEKIVQEGLTCYGTSGTFTSIYRFADTALRTDEPSVVYTSEQESPLLPPAESTIPLVSWERSMFRERTEPLPVQLTIAPSALALGVLCVRYLVRLPQESIDTVFRLYKRVRFRRHADLPRWVQELFDAPDLGRHQMRQLVRCRMIYVGSPLYTALL